jgi:hypothetical protein
VDPFFARLDIPADIGTLAGLQRIVAERVGESRHMDFKRQFNNLDDLAADLCALANVGGGVLVIGISEDNSDRADSFHPQLLSVLEQQAGQAARDGIDEPLSIELTSIDAGNGDGKGYLVVAVLPTGRQPHITVGRGRVLHRVGTHNRPMTRRELGAAFASGGEQFAIEFGLTRSGPVNSVICSHASSFAGVGGAIKIVNAGVTPALNITIESEVGNLRWAKDQHISEEEFGDGPFIDRLMAEGIDNPEYLPIRRLLPGSEVILHYRRSLGLPVQDVLKVIWSTSDGSVHHSEQSWSWATG